MTGHSALQQYNEASTTRTSLSTKGIARHHRQATHSSVLAALEDAYRAGVDPMLEVLAELLALILGTWSREDR